MNGFLVGFAGDDGDDGDDFGRPIYVQCIYSIIGHGLTLPLLGALLNSHSQPLSEIDDERRIGLTYSTNSLPHKVKPPKRRQ